MRLKLSRIGVVGKLTTDGLAETEGETEGEALGEMLAEGETEGLVEDEGDVLGLIEGDVDTEGLTDGEVEVADDRLMSKGLLPLSLRLISNAISWLLVSWLLVHRNIAYKH